jgi:uncharacterized OsmC-like protein
VNHEAIAVAVNRVENFLRRRPEMGVHDDAEATARWQGGLRVVSSHAAGTVVETDLPGELGGSGDRVSPGWLFRAGTASCAATTIVLNAARQGIVLEALEVSVNSRSDSRGLFGMHAVDGTLVPARPLGLEMRVRITAPAVSPERLRELVEDACLCSPIPDAVRSEVPLSVAIEVGTS